MANMHFEIGEGLGNGGFRNRRAARRQTEEMRSRIFAKYQDQVGTVYKNSLAARRAANAELDDKTKHPEYWDNDRYPRLELNITSSCFARAIPSNGGVFLYFRSNPDKAYFYPSAGTTAATAKRVERLVSSGSLGKAYHNYWGKQNGAKKRLTKAGNIDYGIKFPRSPRI